MTSCALLLLLPSRMVCAAHTGAEASSLAARVALGRPVLPHPCLLQGVSRLHQHLCTHLLSHLLLLPVFASLIPAGGAVPCRPLQHWDMGSFLLLLASPGCPPHIGVWAPGWAKCTLAGQINIRLPGPAVSGVFLCPALALPAVLWWEDGTGRAAEWEVGTEELPGSPGTVQLALECAAPQRWHWKGRFSSVSLVPAVGLGFAASPRAAQFFLNTGSSLGL